MKKKYAYLIVFCCMLLQAVPFGIAQNIPPLFIKPLVRNYHFTLEQVGFIFTIGAVAASLFAPFIGKLFNKKSVKWVMLTGLVLSALGVILNSLATKLWQFQLTAAITQVGTIAFSGLGIPYLIGTWFSGKQKAQALGIAFAGGSIGNFFLQPLVENLLSNNPLHRVYFVMGLSSLIVGFLIILFFIKSNTTTDNKGNVEHAIVQKGIGSKQTLKLKPFWFMAIFYSLIGLSVAALSVQYADYFSYLKLDPKIIGLVGSVFAVSCLIGNLLGGVLFGKFGPLVAMKCAGVFQIIALIFLFIGLFNPHMAIVSAFGWGAFYGINVFSYTSAPALIIQELFGMKESSVILGVFSIFFAVGFAIGNIIFGLLVDDFSYLVAWSSVLAYTVIGFFGLLVSIKIILSKKYSEVD